MKSIWVSTALTMVLTCLLGAQMQQRLIEYELNGVSFASQIVWDASHEALRPGVLMVPNWLGMKEASLEKARRIAGRDYVVFMVDMYGVDHQPADTTEASKAASAVRADRRLMRDRVQRGLAQFRDQAGEVPLLVEDIAAIGFCFGGGTVLELARDGGNVDAVVSFHGNLDTPDPSDARAIDCAVLVLHGADDPFVPREQVAGFVKEMQEGDVTNWQLIEFGDAVHSFTDPYANLPGRAEYNEPVADQAFTYMEILFERVFD